MKFSVADLSKEHPIVKAAHAMVVAHGDNETLLPAIDEVREGFPEISQEQLIVLWVGINAKNIAEGFC
jgi:hypothetical protein